MKKVFMEYQEALIYHAPLWNNEELDWIPSSFCGIPRSFYAIRKAPWNTKKRLWNIKKLLWNTLEATMEHQIFFMEYQEARRFFGPGANVRICKGFCTDLRNHSGSIFGPKNNHMLQKTHSQIDAQKWRKVKLTKPRLGVNSIKWHEKGSSGSPKAHENGTKLMPKRPKIHQNDARE